MSTVSAINPIDTVLIGECIEGNRKSQKVFYDFYAARMFAICLRFCGNRMDAEDVLQEGFVKVFKNLCNYRGEGSLEAWIRKIFIHTAIQFARKTKKPIDFSEETLEMVPAKMHNTLDNLYFKDISRLTEKLSKGYKTVFIMYSLEGYSHKEIASELGISISTSKTQFLRARKFLMKLVSADTALVTNT